MLHDHREQACGCHGSGAGGGAEWQAGGGRCKLLYVEWINSKVLLYGTGNYNILICAC